MINQGPRMSRMDIIGCTAAGIGLALAGVVVIHWAAPILIAITHLFGM